MNEELSKKADRNEMFYFKQDGSLVQVQKNPELPITVKTEEVIINNPNNPNLQKYITTMLNYWTNMENIAAASKGGTPEEILRTFKQTPTYAFMKRLLKNPTLSKGINSDTYKKFTEFMAK